MLKLKRGSAYADSIRAYKVVLDGNVIGKIRDGEQLDFDIPPGIHELQLKIDWCGSNSIHFEKTDEDIELECGSSLTGLRIFVGFFYILFKCNEYLWLDSPQVKSSSPS